MQLGHQHRTSPSTLISSEVGFPHKGCGQPGLQERAPRRCQVPRSETRTRHWPGARDTAVTETEAALPWEIGKKTEQADQLDSLAKEVVGEGCPKAKEGWCQGI